MDQAKLELVRELLTEVFTFIEDCPTDLSCDFLDQSASDIDIVLTECSKHIPKDAGKEH